MNVLLWILAGGLAGLVAFVALNLNLSRGLIISVLIGMAGALFGGYVLGPVLGAPVPQPGALSPFALLVAAATALGCLSITDMTHKRFGF
ncbi:MAG: GlsB/YeaQ/YmgE family stress response membrane protein [Burkholderiales bacterium]